MGGVAYCPSFPFPFFPFLFRKKVGYRGRGKKKLLSVCIHFKDHRRCTRLGLFLLFSLFLSLFFVWALSVILYHEACFLRSFPFPFLSFLVFLSMSFTVL